MSQLSFHDAKHTIDRFQAFKANPDACHKIDFLTPLLAVSLCGAFNANRVQRSQVSFGVDAESYAQNYGLLNPINPADARNNSRHGLTYCPIQEISDPNHVDYCNENMSTLLINQLADCKNKDLVYATCNVIGELHDNVASHANDRGYSAAQVYRREQKQIQIAVADIGRGIAGSVRSAGGEYREYDDKKALEWCLVRGNTRAKLRQVPEDLIGPQRIDPYSNYNPYPIGTPVTAETNHHMGEGLYKLVELIKETQGKTWIWSGSASMLNDKGSTIWIDPGLDWTGTIVAIEIPIVAFQESTVARSNAKFEELARRLKL